MSKVIKSPHLSEQAFAIPVHGATAADTHPDGTADNKSSEPDQVATAEDGVGRETDMETIKVSAFNHGFEEGRRSAEQRLAREKAEQEQLLTKIGQEVESFYTKMEKRMLDVILAIVKKIIGQSDHLNPDLIKESLKKVLGKQDDLGGVLTLRLNPRDYKKIAPDRQVMPTNLRLLPDQSIQPGGTLLETPYGFIDSRLESQLEELERMLRDQFADGRVPLQAKAMVEEAQEIRSEGRVLNIVGTVLESRGPNVTIGEQCDIIGANRQQRVRAEVIGFKDNRVLMMPLGEKHGIGPGSRIIAHGQPFTIHASEQLLGRILDGLGQPIDDQGPIFGGEAVSIHNTPNNPMQRRPIEKPLYTGVKAIDGLLTCGKGGRMGIFAGSGVGKSTLLGMMARNTSADINVIALIGERGREVREFIENDLGQEGLQRSVVIAVTSDESPILRIHGAKLAASVAEYFARQGKDVLFMMDSVTRFAMAQREIGLAVGEPPTTKGYTPSTFAELPKLLERSGNFSQQGSITGFYTVLVEGDDMDEPVSDHVRSILDGHIVLSRSLFSQNHFPAIDVLPSISRLAKQVCSPEQGRWGGMIRDHLAAFAEAQDLINIGAYVQGSNPKIDKAMAVIDDIRAFLKQRVNEKIAVDQVWPLLERIIKKIEGQGV